ncbi:Spo0B domain-containing protein [Selenomonadales bacterium OttesenSCG-928-I06]|nr:Spo0B domain-containing protein [Selenomonadales bacterium OttesenSCG-928-I06]
MALKLENPSEKLSLETLKLLRRQRHDFLNHLQIIHSLIVLDKSPKALEYIEEIAKDPNWLEKTISDNTE